jgi:hypothetical protein
MTIQHKNISEADLHEPKGVSLATANKVYVSDGEGSGSWQTLPAKLYAEIYIDQGTTTQTLAASSAYSKLNPTTSTVIDDETIITSEWTDNLKSGLTTSPVDGEITLTTAGIYLIEFWIVFDTAAISSGAIYNFKFAINGTPTPRIVGTKKTTNGADRIHLSAQGLANVSANDVLSVYVAGDGTSSSTAITVKEAGLIAVKLAG